MAYRLICDHGGGHQLGYHVFNGPHRGAGSWRCLPSLTDAPGLDFLEPVGCKIPPASSRAMARG